ncbi:hypothetical protein DY000_02001876 [Brassica cretica]|uniref:acyl-CoA oxidase n=1 Tax=Brassica cretica TaxID=69181 RepID=A0ABQ7CD50_BRACR|nr:hypothetical protein DY000_02001876 [Brassica cretica]
MEGGDHLAHERNKAEFDVNEMKIVWAGSRHAFEVSNRMSRLVASDPVFDKSNRAVMTRKELFKNTLRKSAHAWKLINELRLSDEESVIFKYFMDQPGFLDLHWRMFVPAIKGQGTEEQKQKWLPLANKMQIIGCYAQTELGHGSNVQGLETTATFDPQTDQFILHSPTQTSSKWWPGGLGKVSTHAVVYARLITNGKDHGVHGFIVQLRNLDDHSPLPGITIGDIGVKFGNGAYNSMDNGFLMFDKFCIPRDQMLMRLSKVTREGKYVPSDVPRQLMYGTMVSVRQTIVSNASVAMARAACIATRYSAVRRQFGSQNGGIETQVIDYKTQQNRLFPLLASAYAFRFVGEWLKWLYTDVTQRLEASDFATLPEAHACTAGLKFIAKLEGDIKGKGVKNQLKNLCYIYALHLIHKHLGDFLSTNTITPEQASLANNQLRSLYSQLRPNAVALVDAFDYTDHYLGSVLGRYDGNVYPKLFEEALKDPLNDSVVPDGYHEYIRPFIKQHLRSARL